MEKENINARFVNAINELIKYNPSLSKGKIATMLSIKPAKFSEILNYRMNVGVELVASLVNQFNISSNWILLGEGNMFNEDANNIKQKDPQEGSIETRPRIPISAAAGSLSIVTQSVTEAQCERIPLNPNMPDYDFTIFVKGDSMEPEFRSGDELACKLLRESAFIQWGYPHVIDSAEGVVIKRIQDAGDDILCTSDNRNYGDFKIPKCEINHLALVVGSSRIY